MLRKLIFGLGLVLAVSAAQRAAAFSLWGPLETWQTADLGYGARWYYEHIEDDSELGSDENGGTKNFGEGSRLTTPVLTYAYDATFLTYFGAQGEAAIDSAFKVLNALPSASSANLDNYLTDGNEQINYTAQALNLLDLKSTVLWLMAEHMGLLGETHVFDLALRTHYGTPTCAYNYFVINRNYDPGTYNPTVYVNGRQYGYTIWDGCPIGIAAGDAIEATADTTLPRFTAVATPQALEFGGYYLNFSRDDVGGLKYLYSKGNYAYQGLDSNSVVSPTLSSWEGISTNGATGDISNFVGLIGGVEKITFVKVKYDSQLNPGFTPITYHFSVPYVTNSRLTKLSITRTVTAPDIIFTAANLIASEALPNDLPLARTNGFIQTTYVSPGGGILPSTISASEVIVMNNIGPIYWNYSPVSLDSQDYYQYPIMNWGSFDGSTNAPVVFPNGASLAALEQEVLEGGQTVPLNEWAPVDNTATNSQSGATGGNGAGGGQ